MLEHIRVRASTRQILPAIALNAIFSAAAVAQEASAPSDLHKSLVGILDHQADEWNKGDLEKFMDAYWRSDKLTFSSGGKTVRGWQATLDRYRERYSDKAAMGHLTFSELEVTPLGPDAALMLGHWHLTAHEQDFDGNFSLAWRKIDDQWKIIHDHSSAAEPAK